MSTAWRNSLRPASWRDLPFFVQAGEGVVGRRVQVHEYPFRDDPWPEDLGRLTRGFLVRGYLVGDDVAEQLRAFEEAAETAGSGSLVHPFRGTKTVTLIRCTSGESFEEGRVVRVTLELVESGERLFPEVLLNGRDAVGGAASALDAASAEVGASGVVATVKQGYAGVQSLVRTAQSYAATARSLVGSAANSIRSVTSVLGSISGLGNLGRYARGLRQVTAVLGRVTSLGTGTTAALGRITAARANVERLAGQVTTLAGRL